MPLSRVFLLLMLFAALPAEAAEKLFRISTENTPQHVQTRMIQRFADLLAARGQGVFKVQLHHSATLFRDSDIVRALNEGKVEMAVPGMWQLDRFAPDLGVFMLPAFQGRDATIHHRLRDGPLGQRVAAQVQDAINVVVIGRWIDLGHAQLFFTDPAIRTLGDVSGQRIRIAGGDVNAAMVRSLGARPVVIPWPDLPAALDAGNVSGVLTSPETVVSAALWRNGIRREIEDRDYFAQYLPLVSHGFWGQLSMRQRQLISECWEAIVDDARAEAAAAQIEARRRLVAAGVAIETPSPTDLAAWRGHGIADQAQLAERLGIHADLLHQAMQELERLDQ